MKRGWRYRIRRWVFAVFVLLVVVSFYVVNGLYGYAADVKSETTIYLPLIHDDSCDVRSPAEVVNITAFELNIAIGDEHREISGEELRCFSDPVRFYVSGDGFVCAITSADTGTTPGSDNVRCELQEIYRWDSAGRHRLVVELQIMQLPYTDERLDNLVVCQIHDSSDDVAQCRTNVNDDGQKTITAHNDNPNGGGKVNVSLVEYDVGENLQLELIAENGIVTYIARNLSRQLEGKAYSFPASGRQWSFMAGAYAQCSPEDDLDCVASVRLSRVSVFHD